MYVFANTISLGLNLGLPISIIASVSDIFSLDAWQLGMIVAIGPAFTAIVSLFAGDLGDKFGRWALTSLSVLISAIGGLVIVSAQGYVQLLVGRSLHGMSIGFQMVCIALYTAEASPSHLRGSFGTMTEIFINLGILGEVLGAYGLSQGLGVSAHNDWRWLTWISAGLSSVLILCLWWLPESPRWYAAQGRWEEAECTLQKLLADPDESRAVIAQLRVEIESAGSGEVMPFGSKIAVLFGLNQKLRLPMLRAQGMAFFHHWTGIVAPSIFSTILLQEHYGKKEAQLGTVVIFVFKFLAIVPSTVLVDRAGRRPLLVASCLILASGYILWAVSDGSSFLWTAFALAICVVGFSVGIGPLNYVIPGEVLPLSIRAWGISMANVTCRITEASISLALLPAMELFGLVPCLVVLIGNCFTGLLFFWFVMPENKQLILEKSSQS